MLRLTLLASGGDTMSRKPPALIPVVASSRDQADRLREQAEKIVKLSGASTIRLGVGRLRGAYPTPINPETRRYPFVRVGTESA